MNLYDIDRAIMECIDAETGEVVDIDKLSALTMERDTKVENIALWIKNLLAEADALDAEKKAFEERAKAAKAKAESLKRYLTDALAGQKFKTTRVQVTFRASQSVNITDEAALPQEYVRVKTETAPDKTAIKEALKAGIAVTGAELVDTLNPQIK